MNIGGNTGGFVSSTSAVDSIPKLRPCHRRRDFPCWLSSASSGRGPWLCWRAPEDAGPVSGRARGLEWRHIGLKDILGDFEGGLQLLSHLLILPVFVSRHRAGHSAFSCSRSPARSRLAFHSLSASRKRRSLWRVSLSVRSPFSSKRW